jgi:superfamily I DNA/RNA helicase
MRRIVRLLSEHVEGKRILLLSFTRTAAHDLRDKIASLGVEGADSVRASTLHAYCFGLLQRDAVFAITGRTARPLMEHEQDLMLRDLEGEFGNIFEKRALLEAFEAGWARGEADHPGNAAKPGDHAFEAQTIRWLLHHRAILVGEVVPIAYNYLKHNSNSDELGRFDHVIVDEYQDLNYLEQDFLNLLSENDSADLCIAGDDDQSIYSFRHANPDGIQKFLKREDVENHEIDISGRCPRVVLSMANSLISHSHDRDKPPLKCLNTELDGDVSIVQWLDLDDEIAGLVASIVSDIVAERRSPGDILVLTNRRKIGVAIRKALTDLELPAHSFFTEEAVKKSDAQYALALLWLLVEDDPVSLRVILGHGDSDGRSSSYRNLMSYCRTEGVSERSALQMVHEGKKLPINTKALSTQYDRALAIIQQLPTENVSELVDALFPADNEDFEDLRQISLEALPEITTTKELLAALVVGITQVDVPPSPDFVRVMSLHKSKGLTSPVVYVAGLVDGIVPTIPSGNHTTEIQIDAAVEEQRRLLYVALTRASSQLVLSYSSRMEVGLAMSLRVTMNTEDIRYSDGVKVVPTIASRYISELGADAPRAERGSAWLASRLSGD